MATMTGREIGIRREKLKVKSKGWKPRGCYANFYSMIHKNEHECWMCCTDTEQHECMKATKRMEGII